MSFSNPILLFINFIPYLIALLFSNILSNPPTEGSEFKGTNEQWKEIVGNLLMSGNVYSAAAFGQGTDNLTVAQELGFISEQEKNMIAEEMGITDRFARYTLGLNNEFYNSNKGQTSILSYEDLGYLESLSNSEEVLDQNYYEAFKYIFDCTITLVKRLF